MPRKQPVIHAQFNVYPNGGQRLLGLAEVTMPAFEAMAESLTGAGIMGTIDVPVTGQFNALTLTMLFKVLHGDPLDFIVSRTYRFDLRSAIELENTASYERSVAAERWTFTGPIKKIDPGKRAPQSVADASIDVAVRQAVHYMDGVKKLEFDPLNNIYTVNGVDVYGPIREAIS